MRLPLFSALLLSCAYVASPLADEGQSVWRLFVSDSASPKVSVIDLADDTTLESFALTAPASVYATPSGAGIFAVQGKGDVVAAISSGIGHEDHGDHSDLTVSDPALIEATASGVKPTHFVEHDDKIALFFDGSGKIALVDEHDWLAGTYAPTEFDSGKPHHGVAVPFNSGVLASKPVAEDGKLPTGINVFDAKGTIIATTDLCADLHGEAASGNLIAFGCSDGVLIVSGKTPEFTLLPFTDFPEGRVGTLLGGKGLEFFLANYGPKTLAVIEPAEETPIALVDLPANRVHFALDKHNTRLAYILLADGSVHEFDVVTKSFKRSVSVTGAYATDGGHGVPMPRLAQADDLLLVSDPAAGKVHKLDLESFTLSGSIELGGAPSSIVAVGGVKADH